MRELLRVRQDADATRERPLSLPVPLFPFLSLSLFPYLALFPSRSLFLSRSLLFSFSLFLSLSPPLCHVL